MVTKIMLRIDDYIQSRRAAPGRVQARSERPALLEGEACRGTLQSVQLQMETVFLCLRTC